MIFLASYVSDSSQVGSYAFRSDCSLQGLKVPLDFYTHIHLYAVWTLSFILRRDCLYQVKRDSYTSGHSVYVAFTPSPKTEKHTFVGCVVLSAVVGFVRNPGQAALSGYCPPNRYSPSPAVIFITVVRPPVWNRYRGVCKHFSIHFQVNLVHCMSRIIIEADSFMIIIMVILLGYSIIMQRILVVFLVLFT